MREYSIVTFLEELAEDDIEKEMVRLFALEVKDDEVLEKILAKIGDEEG